MRLLGLLLVSALALTGAIAATAASAAQFVSEGSPTTINDSAYGNQLFKLGGGHLFECSGPAFSGTAYGNKTEEAGGGYATSVYSSSTISDPSCISTTVKWNGCQLKLRAPTEGTSKGTVEIGPSGCGPIKVLLFGSCEWSIPAQKGIAATYSNFGTGTEREVSVGISGSFKYTTVSGGGCGGIGPHSDGQWAANFTVNGSDWKGSSVGIRVAEVAASKGFYIGEDPKAKEVQFQAEEYAASLVGAVSKTHIFGVVAGMTMECGSGALSATLGSPNPVLPVNASYTSCAERLGQKVTVSMNSCQYVLGASGPSSGAAGVSCGKSGDVIEFHVGSICTYGLPAQEIGSAAFSATEGERPGLAGEVSGSGLKYTRIYNGLFCPKASESGSFSGGFTLGLK